VAIRLVDGPLVHERSSHCPAQCRAAPLPPLNVEAGAPELQGHLLVAQPVIIDCPMSGMLLDIFDTRPKGMYLFDLKPLV
jgi:hypothetical protein